MAKSKKRKTARRRRAVVSAVEPAPSKPDPVLAAELRRYAATVDVSGERQRPRLLSLLFCDFANFTIDKKINLLGIFDRIFVNPENPQTPIFTLFIRTAETVEEQLTVTLFDPKGQPALGFKFGGEQQTYTPNLPAQIQLVIGLQFKPQMDGVYWFDVSYKGISLGGAGLVVEYRTEQNHGTDTYV